MWHFICRRKIYIVIPTCVFTPFPHSSLYTDSGKRENQVKIITDDCPKVFILHLNLKSIYESKSAQIDYYSYLMKGINLYIFMRSF